MALSDNTARLQAALAVAKALPQYVPPLDTSDANATADDILTGKSGYVNGEKVEGTMPDNGEISLTIDGIDNTSVLVPEGYTSGGRVSMTDDIPNEVSAQTTLISQIKTALEGKTAGSGGSGGAKIATGTFTSQSPVLETPIAHSLNEIPNFIAVFTNENVTIDYSLCSFFVYECGDIVMSSLIAMLNNAVVSTHNPAVVFKSFDGVPHKVNNQTISISRNDEAFSFGATGSVNDYAVGNSDNFSFYVQPNTTYHWIAGVI